MFKKFDAFMADRWNDPWLVMLLVLLMGTPIALGKAIPAPAFQQAMFVVLAAMIALTYVLVIRAAFVTAKSGEVLWVSKRNRKD